MDILQEEIKNADEKNGLGDVDSSRLLSFIERIERLEEEKKSVQDDIREVFSQAKGEGWSVKAIREVLKLRKLDTYSLDAHDFLVAEYRKMAGI